MIITTALCTTRPPVRRACDNTIWRKFAKMADAWNGLFRVQCARSDGNLRLVIYSNSPVEYFSLFIIIIFFCKKCTNKCICNIKIFIRDMFVMMMLLTC